MKKFKDLKVGEKSPAWKARISWSLKDGESVTYETGTIERKTAKTWKVNNRFIFMKEIITEGNHFRFISEEIHETKEEALNHFLKTTKDEIDGYKNKIKNLEKKLKMIVKAGAKNK